MVASYVPKFTYIIPFRYRQDRILPLRRVVEWLSGFQGVEIMIVEQDTHSKIDYMNLKATHIFCKSDAPFNKSWAYNIGLRRSTAPVIICGESDYIMDPMELIECLKTMDNCDCVIPTSKTLNLTQQQSALDTVSLLQLKGGVTKKNLLDGISIYKKDSLIKIAGWNEDFIGLGLENDFNEMKVRKYLKIKDFDYTGYHIFHFPDITPPTLAQRNQQIFDVYKNQPHLLDQHLNQTLHKIGELNRFATLIT